MADLFFSHNIFSVGYLFGISEALYIGTSSHYQIKIFLCGLIWFVGEESPGSIGEITALLIQCSL